MTWRRSAASRGDASVVAGEATVLAEAFLGFEVGYGTQQFAAMAKQDTNLL